MLWAYRVLFLPLLLLASPYYVWRMLRRGGYAKGFSQRLGLFPALPAKRPGVTRIWIQAVSVGEVEAIGPLLALLCQSGRVEVVLTTTTSTGYQLALQRHAGLCLSIGSFPLDFWPCSAAAWRRIQPDHIVLTEGELWPEHLLGQARRRGIPAYLINARMSDRSFARHQVTSFIAAKLLSAFKWIGAGSELDAERLCELGYPAGQLQVMGNLKFDVAADTALPEQERQKLRAELGFGDNPSAVVLLGSSTWSGEESLLVKLVGELRSEGSDVRLLLVPRHVERREAVRRELVAAGIPFHQRSTAGSVAQPGTVIHFADTTGELSRLTRATDLAFTGKSLAPHEGGQTPVECAAAGIALVYGPHMSNFRSMCAGLEKAGAALRADDAESVVRVLKRLIHDDAARRKMGEAASAWHASNRGASERTAEQLLRQFR
jgi:3-deoxy-D-manno-octulosonic-acid transferase